MEGYLVHGAVHMARGSTLTIEDGAGMLIDVRDGQVWVTEQEGGPDHLVSAGESLRLERGGKTVVEVMRYSIAALSAPMPSNYARRIMVTSPRVAPRVLYDAARDRGSWLDGLRYRYRFL
jgi:hypothetical protein